MEKTSSKPVTGTETHAMADDTGEMKHFCQDFIVFETKQEVFGRNDKTTTFSGACSECHKGYYKLEIELYQVKCDDFSARVTYALGPYPFENDRIMRRHVDRLKNKVLSLYELTL